MKDSRTPALPCSCAVRLSSGETVIVVPGMSGYYPAPEITAEEYNRDHEVTERQVAAVRAGLDAGWGSPEADPANFDEHGEPLQRGPGCSDAWRPPLPRQNSPAVSNKGAEEVERAQGRLAKILSRAGHRVTYDWGIHSWLLIIGTELTVKVAGDEVARQVETVFGFYPYRGDSLCNEEAGCFCTSIPNQSELQPLLMLQWVNEVNKNRSAAGKMIFDQHGLSWISGFPVELLPGARPAFLQALFWRHLEQFRDIYREFLLCFGTGNSGGAGAVDPRAQERGNLKLVHSSRWR